MRVSEQELEIGGLAGACRAAALPLRGAALLRKPRTGLTAREVPVFQFRIGSAAKMTTTLFAASKVEHTTVGKT
jgi:hypothetical protein